MKVNSYIKYLLTGLLFGIIMSKSEVISWYRIHEMFRFESFHMYGIIGSAVAVGVLMVQVMKRSGAKNLYGDDIKFVPKNKGVTRYLIGGTIFGLGWALVGACPGPMFVLIGQGFWPILIVLIGSLLGTFSYGILRSKLPH